MSSILFIFEFWIAIKREIVFESDGRDTFLGQKRSTRKPRLKLVLR